MKIHINLNDYLWQNSDSFHDERSWHVGQWWGRWGKAWIFIIFMILGNHLHQWKDPAFYEEYTARTLDLNPISTLLTLPQEECVSSPSVLNCWSSPTVRKAHVMKFIGDTMARDWEDKKFIAKYNTDDHHLNYLPFY